MEHDACCKGEVATTEFSLRVAQIISLTNVQKYLNSSINNKIMLSWSVDICKNSQQQQSLSMTIHGHTLLQVFKCINEAG